MLTNRAARGAAGLIAAGLLGAVTTACSGTSAVTATATTPATTTAASSSTAPVSATTTSPPASRTPSRTTTPEDSSTRTVYAGPSRTSTLVPWDEPSVRAGGGPTPSAPSGAANLTILLDDGFGIRATWTLTCDPAGGTHPHAKVACGVLGANGAKAFPAAPATGCAEQYGGPQKALVTGTWKGAAVRSQFTLENACEIRRWTAMIGLLPSGGV